MVSASSFHQLVNRAIACGCPRRGYCLAQSGEQSVMHRATPRCGPVGVGLRQVVVFRSAIAVLVGPAMDDRRLLEVAVRRRRRRGPFQRVAVPRIAVRLLARRTG